MLEGRKDAKRIFSSRERVSRVDCPHMNERGSFYNAADQLTRQGARGYARGTMPDPGVLENEPVGVRRATEAIQRFGNVGLDNVPVRTPEEQQNYEVRMQRRAAREENEGNGRRREGRRGRQEEDSTAAIREQLNPQNFTNLEARTIASDIRGRLQQNNLTLDQVNEAISRISGVNMEPLEDAERDEFGNLQILLNDLRGGEQSPEARRETDPRLLAMKPDLDRNYAQKQELYRRLDEARHQHNEERERQLLEEIHRFETNAESQRLKEELKEVFRQLSTNDDLSRSGNLEYLLRDDDVLEYFVTKILSDPIEGDTAEYRLPEFYAAVNFRHIRDKIKSEAQNESLSHTWRNHREAQHERYGRMLLGITFLHNMNSQIATGNIEHFVDVARRVTPDILDTMQKVKGVGTVMRIFEEEFMRVLARDHKITTENYEEILGVLRLGPDGRARDHRPGTVERRVEELDTGMDEWEQRWAFSLGKYLTNITIRGAELISLSQDIHSESFPQEAVARMVDTIHQTGERFGLAEQRGGVKLAAMTDANFHNDRKFRKYDPCYMEEIMGMRRKDFETRGILGITGVWSSWRQDNIILKHAPVFVDGRETSIIGYMDGFKEQNSDLAPPKLLLATFLDTNNELKEEFTNALGVLLKLGAINPTEKDSSALVGAKKKVRAAIWRRVARDNPLAMANFLRGMKFENGHGPAGINATIYALDQELYGQGKWRALQEKLTRAQEYRIATIHLKRRPISFSQAITESLGDRWTGEDEALLHRIQEAGTAVAVEMANIRFPFNPFMNDVIFEEAEYGQAGAEFFRRRLGSDLPSLHNAGNQFLKLMDNPGGIGPEEAMKTFRDMVAALGSPQGIEAAQNNMSPVFEAYLQFIYQGSNIDWDDTAILNHVQGLAAWFERAEVISGVRALLKKPNSLAEVYAGTKAPNLHERELADLLEQALLFGILRKDVPGEEWMDLYVRFRKKFKVGPGGVLLALLRSLIQISPLVAGAVVGVAVGKEVAKAV